MNKTVLALLFLVSFCSATQAQVFYGSPDFSEEFQGKALYYKIIDAGKHYVAFVNSPTYVGGYVDNSYKGLTTFPAEVVHNGINYYVKQIAVRQAPFMVDDFYIPEGVESIVTSINWYGDIKRMHLPTTLKNLGHALQTVMFPCKVIGLEKTQITAINAFSCEQSFALEQHWEFPSTLRRIGDNAIIYNGTLKDKNITLPEHLDSIAYKPWTSNGYGTDPKYERVRLLNPRPALMTHQGNDPTHSYYYNSKDMKDLFGTNVQVVTVPIDATRAYETNTDWSYFAGKYREEVKIGTAGYTTYYLENENFKVPTGCTAYIITGITPSGKHGVPGTAHAQAFGAGKIIPKQTGFILQGTPSSTIEYQANVTGTEENVTGNLLVGTATEQEFSSASYKYYILSNSGDQGLGFYKQGTRDGASIKLKTPSRRSAPACRRCPG